MLELFVGAVALAVFSPVVLQVVLICQPSLEIGFLLFGSISGGGGEVHLVRFGVSWDIHQVVVAAVTVQVAVVVDRVRYTAAAIVDQSDNSGVVCFPLFRVESRYADVVRDIED